MAMTGAGLAAARKAAVDAVTPVQGSSAAAGKAYADALRVADSNAIVTYIQQNMGVASTGIGNLGNPVNSNSNSIT